jgi:hypothetical protein
MEGKMQKWEYAQALYYFYSEKTKKGVRLQVFEKIYENEDVLLRINELGSVGWEIIAVTPIIGSERGAALLDELFSIDPIYTTTTTGFHIWFKRPLAK